MHLPESICNTWELCWSSATGRSMMPFSWSFTTYCSTILPFYTFWQNPTFEGWKAVQRIPFLNWIPSVKISDFFSTNKTTEQAVFWVPMSDSWEWMTCFLDWLCDESDMCLLTFREQDNHKSQSAQRGTRQKKKKTHEESFIWRTFAASLKIKFQCAH